MTEPLKPCWTPGIPTPPMTTEEALEVVCRQGHIDAGMPLLVHHERTVKSAIAAWNRSAE